MDTLDMRGGLGGAAALTLGYAHDPLRVRSTDGSQHVAVVADQALAGFGFATTFERWRLYVDFNMPLVIQGQSGSVGDYQFTGPSVAPGPNPDTLSDARIGLDARLLGRATSPFRLGAGAQFFVPNGNRADYDTDGTYRAMGRLLFAGDIGFWTYAGYLGIHVRPLDDAPAPGSPQGSEFLFGIGGGARLPVSRSVAMALIVGPELYGETAFRSFFASTATALEGLLTGRLEGTGDDGAQLRVKLGVGPGFNQRFGAPEWRFVFAIEVFDHHSDSNKDGVSDKRDAGPDKRGSTMTYPGTNGCPAAGKGDADSRLPARY